MQAAHKLNKAKTMKTMKTIRHQTRQMRRNGFTLVEAIVAVAILGMVAFMMFRSLLSVLDATKIGAEAADHVQRERVAIKTVEDGLRGMVYYEQNQGMYALTVNPDPDAPSFSFVSRVPPNYIGSRDFKGQTLRRLQFSVEYINDKRALILEQSHVMRAPDGEEAMPVVRSVLAPDLAEFIIHFWSTSAEDWIDEWTETNSLPSRVKVEMALTRMDGGLIQLSNVLKREVVIHSVSITKNNQNPALPAAARGRSSGRGSSSRGSSSRGSSSHGSSKSGTRYTPEQIAAYRKKREEDARKRNRENDGKRKLPEGSKRVSDYGRYEQTAKRYDTNGDGILDSGERAKWRADYAASRNSQSSGGSKAAGSGGDTGAGGDGDTGAGGGGVSRGGGPSVLPGALVLNDELTRFDAETLQDLVDAGLYDSMEDLQATAPDGAVWGINPDTGLVVPIFP
jgi:prepilin-type N-terminal cleavage/methylation domain-containing protein